MYIVENEAMNRLLGGNYYLVLDMAKRNKPITIQDLYCLQFEYSSYDGFRKFYNKKLKHIINHISYVDGSGFIGKVLSILFKRG